MNRRDFLAGAAALPFALRAGTALAGGTPVALVTADTEAAVLAVAVGDGRVLRRIAVLPGPRSIESVGGGAAVVAHTALGAVTVLDVPSLRVRHVLRDFEEPRYTAAHPDGRYAYVSDSASGWVLAVDVVRGRTLGRAHVGGWARHLSIDPSGNTLWVGLGTAAEEVAVVDVSRRDRPRLVRRVRAPFGAHDVGFLPGGAGVWLTSGDSRETAVYGRDGIVHARFPAGAPPQHVTFGRGVAYVTSGHDGELVVHALRDGRVLRRTRIPVGSYNVQRGGSFVLTPSLDRGTLTVLGDDGRVVRESRVAASSHDACLVAL